MTFTSYQHDIQITCPYANPNWLDDVGVASMASMKWFTEMEEALIIENEHVNI